MTTTTSTKQQAREAEAILRGERLLPLKSVAMRFDVSTRTVERWIKAGLLSPIDLPGQLRFRVADIVAFEVSRLRRSGGPPRTTNYSRSPHENPLLLSP